MSFTEFLAFANAAFSGVLGLAALVRKRPTLAQWSFALGMLVLAAEAAFIGLGLSASPQQLVRSQLGILVTMACLPLPWILFSLCYSRGNYLATLRKWALPIAVIGGLPVILAVFARDQLIAKVQLDEVAGVWFLVLGMAGSAVNLLLLLASIMVLMNIERTFRASMGTARWRIKYTVLGVGLLFGVRVYTTSQALLFSGEGAPMLLLQVSTLFLACILMAVGMVRTDVAHIDVYPSRYVIHNSLTVILAGIYLLVVGVLAKLVSAWGGDEALSLQALVVLVALVLLSILLLSERLRDHIKRFVSRNFKRPHYEYAQVWPAFAERTASIIDPMALSRVVAKWLSETFRALSVTMWVVDPRNGQLAFGASTSLSESEAAQLLPTGDAATDLVQQLRQHAGPIDLEKHQAGWIESLKHSQPDSFRKGGGKICVSILAGQELLGLIMLGDRVNGVPYTFEELDLLKCVAGQLAGSLQNIQLSQRLLEAKEMEAFQTMSAFFVHDLKNTASTLSLMLQNLPAHYDDPEFRADALRGLAKSVGRINELIGRLGLLRQELDLKVAPADLNDIVAASLVQLPQLPAVTIERTADPLPKIPLDGDKLQKVITNILMNAVDALGEHGRIEVRTEGRPGWAVVSIADNGPGMNPEFVRRSLFRPFQTTKKKGIGIGMFLSKAIVEAHRGKIEVASQPGKGATFRILLPMQ